MEKLNTLFADKEKMKVYTKFLFFLIIALFLEVIVFNITSYRVLLGNYEKKTYNGLEVYNYSENNEKVFLKINNINTEVGTVKVIFKDISEPIEYKIFYSDDTTDEFLGLNSKFYIPTLSKTQYVPVYLSGKVKGIMIEVDTEIYNEEKIEGIVINEKIPFDINLPRFFIILSVLLLGYYLKNGKVFNIEYSIKNLKQEVILIAVLAIFFVITSMINTYSSSELNYGDGWLANISTEGDIYNKDFVEAVKNNKFYIATEPSEELLKLENPYDNYTRDAKVKRDVDYKWDTALYNGHQYVYFGILPLLLVFLPFNLLTNRYLKISIVVFIFSMFIFILLKEILLKIVQRYFTKIPFKNVFFSLIILCSGTLVLYANGMARVYELVIIVGLYFVLQGIYFILKSMEDENKKYFYIFLGSLCLALSVACRPTDLFASILILPYLISLLYQNIKNKNWKDLFKLIISVGIPYLTVGIFLMWYNYIRFDSIFEFGAKYQLTISNMKELGSRIFAVPTGLICNLFSIPIFTSDFPFISNHNNLITFYGYYYIENMIGGLFFIAPICFAIFFIFKINKKIENKELKILLNFLIIVGILLAIVSVMLAGSNQRYLIDYAWMLCLAGILVFLVIYNLLESQETKKMLQFIVSIITVYMFLISVSSGILSEKSYMKDASPEEYYKAKYTICFWE